MDYNVGDRFIRFNADKDDVDYCVIVEIDDTHYTLDVLYGPGTKSEIWRTRWYKDSFPTHLKFKLIKDNKYIKLSKLYI